MIHAERETTATVTDADEVVQIYTCRRKDITALKRKGAKVVSEGIHLDGTPYARFEIPEERFSIARGIRTERNLSPEQRQALADRMRKVGAGE